MNPAVIIAHYARLAFMDSSDEEESIPKIKGYVEDIIPLLPTKQFKQHFRMSPDTFYDLLGKMGSVLQDEEFKHVGYPRSNLDKEAMITIWYLGNLESFRCAGRCRCDDLVTTFLCFRSVAERFGVSKSTCSDIVYRTCKLLLKVNDKFKIICWPSQQSQQTISQAFGVSFPGRFNMNIMLLQTASSIILQY